MNYEYPNQAATELSSIQTPSQVKKNEAMKNNYKWVKFNR